MRRLVLLTFALLLLAPAASALASKTQTMAFEAPRDLRDPATRERALDTIAGFGVKALRVILYWKDVAPSPTASRMPSFAENDARAYDWSIYDPIVDGARARGMRVLLTVSGPVPKWATLPRRDYTTHPSPAHFKQFMSAVAAHFSSRISLWSIWNEPNHPDFLKPQFFRGQPASGQWYRKLFIAGYDGLRLGGEKRPRVLMGETAPTGTSHVVAPLQFLRDALCLNDRYRKRPGCARLPAVGYAHHPYTKASGPYYRPPNPQDVTIGVLGRLQRALDRAGRAGAIRRHLPMYLTEFGIQSVPDPVYGVSQQRQAEFQAISEWMAWRNPRVRWTSQYLLRDSDHLTKGPRFARYPGFESGLRFADNRPKLSLRAFPVPLAALRSGNRVTLWGLARAAHKRTRVAIYVRGKRYKTIVTNRLGYFQKRVPYVRGRTYRLKWAGRFGPPMRVYRRP